MLRNSWWSIVRFKFIGLSVTLIMTFSSCRKSPINPYCWGNLEKALLVIPPPSICAPFVILESTGEWHVISNDLPKSFKNDPRDTIPVLINYKFVEGKVRVPPCGTEKEVKIRCIREQ